MMRVTYREGSMLMNSAMLPIIGCSRSAAPQLPSANKPIPVSAGVQIRNS